MVMMITNITSSNPMPYRPRNHLVVVAAHMHRARAIGAGEVAEARRLCLSLERCVATAHERVAQIVEAVIIVLDCGSVERKVAAAELQEQRVGEMGDGVEAVELVEYGDGVDVLVGEGRVVHGWGEGVGGVAWDVNKTVAT